MGQIGARQLAALTLALQAHARKHVLILLAAVRAARAYALSHSCQFGMKVGAHGEVPVQVSRKDMIRCFEFGSQWLSGLGFTGRLWLESGHMMQ